MEETSDIWQCRGKCKKWLAATPEFFYRHKNKPGGFTSVCKVCIDARRKARKADRIQFVSTGTQEKCAVCARGGGNIIADIDEDTKVIRGYLCSKCFRVLHACQAESHRIRGVADYVERTREWKPLKKKRTGEREGE